MAYTHMYATYQTWPFISVDNMHFMQQQFRPSLGTISLSLSLKMDEVLTSMGYRTAVKSNTWISIFTQSNLHIDHSHKQNLSFTRVNNVSIKQKPPFWALLLNLSQD